ncbi:hypothetical protein DQJ40_20930 [Salmonella enterica subsp. enterica serovar Alachua]|uniref:Uncharacterized protein n=1 Tax=Salmonella enterica TaxID=28901 RepID=A0A5T9L5V3_SALER|nr:hypothetical protein [Salmonella enterica]EBF4011884.1 hypothetical protein [Salmonella enterica subsp. enterica serovar Alachua]EBO0294853.1 hypothetical protein [Salmonella enterica subsp. enterica serovar Alachua]EBS9242750.1 hypothetical protein [Salmonella enterica]EBW7758319.1 hypothetical protein [Salmonella enterica subsp. enterica serovar Alachua]
MLTVSCAVRGGVPVVTDTACDWVKPIYLTAHDIDVMDKQTKRDVLSHNYSWDINCNILVKTKIKP